MPPNADPTYTATRSDARRLSLAHFEPRVLDGQLSGGERELAEAVRLSGGLGVHVVSRLEVVDLRRDLASKTRRIEPIDPLDR